MSTLFNEHLEIPLNGKTIKGTINGDENLWNFKSSHSDFIRLFPAGVTYSFSHHAREVMAPDCKMVHYEVWKGLMRLLEDKDPTSL